ncbi:unnamed protein product, partial [Polarella glacialis]
MPSNTCNRLAQFTAAVVGHTQIETIPSILLDYIHTPNSTVLRIQKCFETRWCKHAELIYSDVAGLASMAAKKDSLKKDSVGFVKEFTNMSMPQTFLGTSTHSAPHV